MVAPMRATRARQDVSPRFPQAIPTALPRERFSPVSYLGRRDHQRYFVTRDPRRLPDLAFMQLYYRILVERLREG